MKFELKAIKHSEFASHETNCYEAKLYIDGKPFCHVSNDGQGGCDNQYPIKEDPAFWDKYKAINAELGKEILTADFDDPSTGKPFEMKNDIEQVCSKLLTQWLIDRDIKRELKKICYVKDGGVYTLQAKHKPTPRNLAEVQKCAWWDKNNIILNGKSVEECRQYFN